MLLLSAFAFILILFLITFFYLKGGDFKEMFKENPDDLNFDEQEEVNYEKNYIFNFSRYICGFFCRVRKNCSEH